ncbi:unannotated protein [freshwater metagenome]|uniref:Unannotated protein n=1 Tax=freshwater metagenome TaxID=449393 RepID=A0A6J6LD07_9ZZZZ|nr:GNAT family N-acetyltransferase [Actinomycetota bacterium]
MSAHKIREIRKTDATWIFEACQDEQIKYWTTIPRPYLIEHAHAFVNGDFPEYKIWAIENEESKPVGVISIHGIDESGAADLGYFVAKWGRGKGAAKDAIAQVESYAKTDPSIKSIAACISDLNTFSQRAAEAAGLKKSDVATRTCRAGDLETSACMYRKMLY